MGAEMEVNLEEEKEEGEEDAELMASLVAREECTQIVESWIELESGEGREALEEQEAD